MAAETAIETTNARSVDVTNPPARRNSWTYRPAVDIFDTPEELLLFADIPGADAGSVDVSMEAGILTIQAQVPSRDPDAVHSVAREYGVGSFHRRFEIDEAIDTEAVSAECRNGALTVRLPKAQQARRRRIPVSA